MGKYITEPQRYQIEILLKEKYSTRQIADTLNHKYNTIYKEIKKGTVKQLDTELREYYAYKADYAQMLYDNSVSNRGRDLKIGSDYVLVAYLEEMIGKRKYSPEAALIQAKKDGLIFDTEICFKTIYNYLDMGLFLNISNKDLPYKKESGKKKAGKKSKVSLHNLKGKSIEERPKEVLDRQEYGHWEMDTVYSAKETGKSCLLVFSERMLREEIVIKMPDRKSESVIKALDQLENTMGIRSFREKFKSITCDNGMEFLDSVSIEKSRYGKGSRTTVYYCHPYSSYERGTNENINRMIRRFFPKGTNFDLVTKKQVRFVQDWINNYPRKIHSGLSANEMMSIYQVA